MKKLLFIVGPTASGKSDFAVQVAKLLKTDVISSDSMQIYKDMTVGTAKITPEEQQGVTHHLIDFVNPKDSFSVAEYREKALPIIDELLKNGKTPIISGGTGLYVNGILYPMNFSDTSKDDKLRKSLENEYDEKGADFMHEKLAALDEKSALKIHKNDKKRVVRALEINLTHGNRDENDMKKPSYEYEMIGLSGGDRAVLYDRINKRVDKMFENGLVDEVKSLINTGVSFDCQSMQAIGYKEFKGFFDGILSENDLKELIKKDTRNYAKRQLTWFRREHEVIWVEKEEFSHDNRKILDFMKKELTERGIL